MFDALFHRLAAASLEVFVLFLLVVAGIRLFKVKSARVRSILWMLVLVKPIVALVIVSPFSVATVSEPSGVSTPLFERPGADLVMARLDLHTNNGNISRAISAGTDSGSGSPTRQIRQSSSERLRASSMNAIHSFRFTLASAISMFWCMGVIVFMLFFLLNQRKVSRLVSRAVPPENPQTMKALQTLCVRCRINRPPALKVSNAIQSPALVGILRPTILIPKWLEADGYEEKLVWSLLHELSHFRVKDHLWFMARRISSSLFFFHPVIWYAGHRWEEEMELACDRAIVTNEHEAQTYAHNLYKILEILKEGDTMKLAHGLFATRTQIGKRIATLLGKGINSPARVTVPALIAFVLIMAGTLTFGLKIVSAADNTNAPAKNALRTKEISSAVKELKMLRTAINAYQVDWNAYPPVMPSLTTPIAYITHVLPDPFTSQDNPTPYMVLAGATPNQSFVYSVGPDGIDNKGGGDDITVNLGTGDVKEEYTIGEEVKPTTKRSREKPMSDQDKLKRLERDTRMIVTAVNAYKVDWNDIPPRYQALTTPIAYLTQFPDDPYSSTLDPYLTYTRIPPDEKKMYYSVGPNGTDESGEGDDILIPAALDTFNAANHEKEMALQREEDIQEIKSLDIEGRKRVATADLRSIAIALEAYKVDYNAYPPSDYLLTTPIAYLTRFPLDPFTVPEKPDVYKNYLDNETGDRVIYSIGPNKSDDLGLGDDIARSIKYEGMVPYTMMQDQKQASRLLETRFRFLGHVLQAHAIQTHKVPASFEEVMQLEAFAPVVKIIKENVADPFKPSQSIALKQGGKPDEVIMQSAGMKPGAEITYPMTLLVNFDQALKDFESDPDSYGKGYLDEIKQFGEDNAAYIYARSMMCFTLINKAINPGDQYGGAYLWDQDKDTLNSACKNPWSPEQMDNLLILFALYEPAFELIHEGRFAKKVILYAGPITYRSPVPNFLAAQILAKILSARAGYYFYKGEIDRSISDLLDNEVFAWRFRSKDSTLIGNLIGIALEGISLYPMERVVASGKLSESQLQEILPTLSEIDESETNIGEIMTNGEFRCFESGINLILQEIEKPEKDAESSLPAGISKSQVLKIKDRVMSDVEWLHKENMKILNTPYDQAIKEHLNDVLEGKIEKMKKENPFLALPRPNYHEALTRYLVSRAKRRIVIVSAALEIYKLKNGAYPQNNDIRGTLNCALLGLKTPLCMDPFLTDTPLHYFSDGITYSVWSVGPDTFAGDEKTLYDPTNGTISPGDVFFAD